MLGTVQMNLSFLTKRVGPGFGMYIQGGAKEETTSILELMSDMFWREKTANRCLLVIRYGLRKLSRRIVIVSYEY
jgi:hypothetical protein